MVLIENTHRSKRYGLCSTSTIHLVHSSGVPDIFMSATREPDILELVYCIPAALALRHDSNYLGGHRNHPETACKSAHFISKLPNLFGWDLAENCVTDYDLSEIRV